MNRFLYRPVFISVGHIPRSGIAGSYGNSMFKIWGAAKLFLKVLHCFTFPLTMRILISLHPHQHLLLSLSFILAILEDVKWYIIVVLIYIFLVINDVEHLFICLVAIYLLWKKCLLHTLNWVICLFIVDCMCLLYIPDTASY